MIISQARQSSSILQMVVVLALLFSLLPARGFAQEPLPLAKIHPALREVMQEENSQLMRVIVQASGPLAAVRQGIHAAGGVIIRDLSIINAVVADMPAAGLDNLARSSLVQAISPDAPVLKTADSTGGTVVLQQDFNGSTKGTPRTVNWNWYEVGEEDGFDSGNVVITSFLAGTAEGVRFQNSEMGVQATVDLRTALNATLSMNYRRKEFTSAQDAVLLQVSTDGGVAWQEVARLAGPATDPMLQVSHYDLSAFRGHEVLIRLITFAEMSSGARFYLDFVQVQYEEDPQFSAHKVLLPLISAPNSVAAHANNEISSANGTFFVRDEFNSTSYTNNDGTQQWSGGWIESGDNDSPSSGDITVEIDECPDVNSRCIEFDGDADLNSSVAREVNLGGIGSATLTFDYHLDISGALYVLEASNNGGTSWQILKNYSAPATVIGESIDLTPYAATNTRIRFRLADREDNAHFSIDNVQVTWNAVVPLDLPGDDGITFVRDEFNSTSYTNNDGSQQWSGGWIESGDNGSPTGGDITVEIDECPDVNSQCIEFDGDADLNSSVAREVNLGGIGSATLTFDYDLDISGALYVLEASNNGGTSWQTLKNYSAPATVIGESIDLTPYAATNTRIRFRLADREDNAHLSIDNVQITWSAVAPLSVPDGASVWTVRDEFNSISYSNNDGTQQWSGGWIESGDNGSPSGGDITVEFDECPDVNSQCIEFDADADLNSSLARQVDLSGGGSALLSFDYHLDESGAVYALEVSTDGGATWQTLKNYVSPAIVIGEKVDLTPYTAVNTQIRFRLADDDDDAHISIDNVQIEWGDGDFIDTTNLASTYVKSIKADRLWNNKVKRLRGRNVTVAVVDSGIARHFDLDDDDDDDDGRAGRDDGRRSRILAHVDFTGGGFLDDFYGHGTHVAGIIAGNGKESNNTYMGVAPNANLVDVKVTDDYGVGSTADVVAGLEWVLEHKDLYNIRVVNMSLNSTLAESYHTSPLDAAVEILWFNGIVVVVSAGNNGSTNAGTIYPPANDPFIITVGAVDDMGTQTIDDDILATYSAYGLTSDGFLKPEIVVPGSNIIASLSGDDANLALDHPSHSVTGPAGTFYFRMSGTSMASAVVAGSVALLLEDEPNLTPDQVKYRLMATASYPIEIPLAVPTPDITTFRPAYMDIKAAVDGTTVEIANQGVMPHLVLAKMAMMAYWATTNGEEAIDWSSVNWNSVNWNSVNWNSVNWNSVNWNSVNWNSVNWNSVNWNSVNWNSVNWNSVNWNSGFTWSSVNWNSGFTWSSVNWNSVHWDD